MDEDFYGGKTLQQLYDEMLAATELKALALSVNKIKPPIQPDYEEEEMSAIACKPGFTIGADPELFIVEEDGRHVSAEGLIPGTKEDPFKVPGGAIQVDGMAAEFNIDPSSSFEEFNDNIIAVMKHLKTFLPKGHRFSIIPSVEFDEDVFDKTPDKAKELGCSPDLNAWTGAFNPPPNLVSKPRLRCAGGHLHVGWTDGAETSDVQHVMNCRDLVKQLDWFLGAWSVTQDKDAERRRLYGKAGACRIKPYGVEYRVLSNFWLTSKPLRLATWNRLQRAIHDMSKRFLPDFFPTMYNKELIKSINTSKMAPIILSDDCHYPVKTVNI